MKKKRQKRRKEQKKERAVIIIKPDAIERKLTSKVLFRFEREGLKIVALKMIKLKKSTISKLYAPLKLKLHPKLFNAICKWMASVPVVVGVVEGAHAIKKARKIAGPTNPAEAYRGTIRGDFSQDDQAKRAKRNLPTRNIVHVSATRGEANKELHLFRSLIKVK
ncbi:nucleoside-diphosphate kinase [Candidatus Pacearchaeota archaeon]|nr:nucleoside-diphosphate kinase [Candidatus Pacearchaeota archaeon]